MTPKWYIAAAIVALSLNAAYAQKMSSSTETIQVNHVRADFSVTDLDNKAWKEANEVEVKSYWSGERAPAGRQFKAKLLWSDTALYIRFEAAQSEPLVVNDEPDLTRKTMNLWDRDVCEIFIAPDRSKPNKYFEFEVAPTGEWIDVGIEVLPDKRISDWEYRSGMQSAARIERGRVIMAIRIEWKALGKTPTPGEAWLGNLYRCVGRDPGRGYLAWRPTMTSTPAFHVPGKFGEFVFVGNDRGGN
ncbi:MAG TPA: carbohydrate-binding family 9-like protein [Pyrinomonadaceae bacterium]|nr:carbohydrate-binding family 9-like protein [Pyrinomonadaceae bacterium]